MQKKNLTPPVSNLATTIPEPEETSAPEIASPSDLPPEAPSSEVPVPVTGGNGETEADMENILNELRTYHFRRPVTIAGKTYSEISLDFSSLSTKDFLFIAAQTRRRYAMADTSEIYKEDAFRIMAALFLNKIPFEDVEEIPMADGMRISNQALFTLGR